MSLTGVYILEKFVFRGANICVSLMGFGACCLGWRPGTATVDEAPINNVLSHIGLLLTRVLDPPQTIEID